tara:strand:+ start:5224 stop:5811 length:588 start_codon:yes stop_codon:yes gene_type:complete
MNYTFLIFIILLIIIFYNNNVNKINKNIISVKSGIDNKEYLVLDLPDSKKAADILATININIKVILECEKDSKLNSIKLLKEKYNPNTLCELKNDKYTAYSLNKGEKLAICIRNNGSLINDMNTTMFIIIHELAHIMSVSEQHTEEFWQNMKLLIYKAKECGVYTPIDYSNNNVKYCNSILNSSPYFNNNYLVDK